jgi:hypothetical protein
MLLGQKDISTIALKYAIMFHIFICFLTDLCTEVSALKKNYIDCSVHAVCNYPLSAACCLNRICSALEQKWKIQ